MPSTHYLLYDFDLHATHARKLLPAALASVSFGFVLVRVRSKKIPQGRVVAVVDLFQVASMHDDYGPRCEARS